MPTELSTRKGANQSLDEMVDLALQDLEVEDLEITDIPDALQLPETAASCMASCCTGSCCCTSVAV